MKQAESKEEESAANISTLSLVLTIKGGGNILPTSLPTHMSHACIRTI